MNTPNKGDNLADKITNVIQLYAPIDSRIKAALERALAKYRAPLPSVEIIKGAAVGFQQMSDGLTSLELELKRERDELRARLQYVTGQLIEAGLDCGAAPVEELARRAKKESAELRAEVERLQPHKLRLDWLLKVGLYFRGADKFDPNWRVGNETEFLYDRPDARQVIDAAMEGAE